MGARRDGKIKRRRLVTGQQVGVAAERERRGVVAERAAELEQVRALAEVEGGEGVAEGMEAGPGRVDLLDERLEHPPTEVVRLDHAAGLVREDERGRVVIGLLGEVDA